MATIPLYLVKYLYNFLRKQKYEGPASIISHKIHLSEEGIRSSSRPEAQNPPIIQISRETVIK